MRAFFRIRRMCMFRAIIRIHDETQAFSKQINLKEKKKKRVSIGNSVERSA